MLEEPMQLRTFLKFALIAMGLFFTVLYIAFQARFMISGPEITLVDEPPLLNNERQVFLSGRTFNISRLWLNDRPIYTDAQGNFKEALILENGYTVSTLKAVDRYGRETTVTKQFVYLPISYIQ